MTLRQFSGKPRTIPTVASWYLADLAEARGKQELYTRQSPQRLRVLREHALIESAVSSNRIEGVRVDQARIQTVLFGRAQLRDRDEEEVRGYRNALKLLPPGLRGRPLHQPGAADRTKQGPLLRDAGAELAALARWQARSLALHQLSVVRPQDRLAGVRRARWPGQEPARRQDRADRIGGRRIPRRIRRGGSRARLPGRQPGHDPPRAAGPAQREQGRVSGAGPGGAVAEKGYYPQKRAKERVISGRHLIGTQSTPSARREARLCR